MVDLLHTPNATLLLSLAEEQVRDRGHRQLGPEHLLLALTGLPHAGGALVLHRLGVPRDALLARLEKASPRHRRPATGAITASKATTATLRRAAEEAAALRFPRVGTEHLVLGILRDPSTLGALAITGFGVTLLAARREVAALPRPEAPGDLHIRTRPGEGDFHLAPGEDPTPAAPTIEPPGEDGGPPGSPPGSPRPLGPPAPPEPPAAG